MATTVSLEAACACETPAAPASRASWCGQLRLGAILVPVKAYAAIATPPEVPLRQLHAGCGKRIEYHKCCPEHGQVPAEEIVKGYPYQTEQYVELAESELAQLEPVDEKTIQLEHFFDPSLVDLALLAGRSLYLAPANPAAHKPFATVRQALAQSGKWAIGRVVLSSRWQIVLVHPLDQLLLVHTLHHPAQRRALPSGELSQVEIQQQELRLLVREINAAKGAIPWMDYQDDWQRRLTELVEAKVAARSHSRTNCSPRTSSKRRSASASRGKAA